MPVAMINKPVVFLNIIDCIYAGVEYINKDLEYVRYLYINGLSYFNYSTMLRNVK